MQKNETISLVENLFRISSIFSSNIVFRNKAKNKDYIYVTGEIGDSFIGLNCLKKLI